MTDTQPPVSQHAQGNLYRYLGWLVTILVPLAVVLSAVRLMLTPVFVNFEYSTPNFPADPYGFTREDRLHYSKIALAYLLNNEDISFLGDLSFPDGSPVYNERELRHMADVKAVVRIALFVWYVSIGLLLIMDIWAWRGKWWEEFRSGMARGGNLTLLLIGLAMVAVLVGFGVFFVFFHQVFFESGTWVFRFSDTLIRLFPERFWRDTFLAVGALSLAGGLAVRYGFRKKKKKPPPEEAAA
jgi:integral membrane protein (TIGR01906 family)